MIRTSAIMILAGLGCASDGGMKVEKDKTSTESTTSEDTDSDTTDTDTTDTDTTDTGTTTTGPDCSVLPPTPVNYQTINFFETAEDFDIDGDGYLGTIDSGNLVGTDMNGDRILIAPNMVSGGSAGTRVLPNGDWVIADVGAGSLKLWEVASGVKRTLLAGLAYPNGVEVDSNSYVYVAENSGARLRWVHSVTGDSGTISNTLVQPNGVILSPDEQTIYVGSFGGGVVYAIDRVAPNTQEWTNQRVLYETQGPDGGFDGVNVDICGNVYITEFTTGKIYRISPDGLDTALVVDLPSFWIPNMRWGHGINGWDTDILYVSDFGKIYALEMGIEGKKHILLP
jgi:sugar lactone lactonase YvrE